MLKCIWQILDYTHTHIYVYVSLKKHVDFVGIKIYWRECPHNFWRVLCRQLSIGAIWIIDTLDSILTKHSKFIFAEPEATTWTLILMLYH
jgi:hypothetical protein